MNKRSTLDGIEVSVMSNARSREDVELAMAHGADGIGLFRTEPFFLSTKHFPSDREFAEFLLEQPSPGAESISTFDLLDIGADKNPSTSICHRSPIPSWDGAACVCCLSIRTCWKRSCGLYAGSVSQQFGIGVLIPMVTTERDVVHIVDLDYINWLLKWVFVELPRIGAMIETPAAALSIPS
jgi:phosphoenolpyruvate-protein kinase (PTS system EI component)